MAQVKYRIVEKWGNFDAAKKSDVERLFPSKEDAQIECDALNAKRPFFHFNVFVVEEI